MSPTRIVAQEVYYTWICTIFTLFAKINANVCNLPAWIRVRLPNCKANCEINRTFFCSFFNYTNILQLYRTNIKFQSKYVSIN